MELFAGFPFDKPNFCDAQGGLLGARTAVLAEHLGFDLRQQQEEDDDESASDPEEGSDFSYDATISEQDEEVRPVPTDVPSVPSCSYLMPGRTFTGHQRLSGAAHRRQEVRPGEGNWKGGGPGWGLACTQRAEGRERLVARWVGPRTDVTR